MFDFLRKQPTPFAEERVCFLHVGPHKTASTSLQYALYANAAKLARIGLSYPTDLVPGERRRRNHTPLARRDWFRQPGPLEEAPVWSDFADLLRGTPGSIIVSTEHFAVLMRKAAWFAKIVAFFERLGFRVVIVSFVRDQPLWLNSWYVQHQKNMTSQRDFAGFAEHVYNRGYLDPWRIARRVRAHPDVEARPISFERAVKAGLARSFFEAIGAPASFVVDEPPRINPNLGVKGVYAAQEIMRRVGQPIRSLPNYIDLYEHFLVLMKGRDWDATPYVAITQDDYRAIRERFAKANESFSLAHFGASWADIAPERRVERRVFDVDAASPAERAEVMAVVDEMTALIRASPQPAG